MISVIAMKYCVIKNPVVRDKVGNVVFDNCGQANVKLGDTEIRFAQDPFPLYPGEVLLQQIQDLPVVFANDALHLMALTNFVDDDGNERTAREEWLFEGPGTYVPRKEVEIIEEISAKLIKRNQALVLQAKRDCVDRNGNHRVCGERWLVKTLGAYLPGVYEEVVEERKAHVLTDSTALHLKALRDFTDDYNIQRRIGEEWLLTKQDTRSHICGVHEALVEVVSVTVLKGHQYCFIEYAVGYKKVRKLVQGEKSLFLRPGEYSHMGVQDMLLLQLDEYVMLEANEEFEDEIIERDANGIERKRKVFRKIGDRWTLYGPMLYLCPATEVFDHYKARLDPLDPTESVYVRNTQTGHIRAIIGEAYAPNGYEELWEKILPLRVVNILESYNEQLANSPKYLRFYDPATYQVPHNAAVQIYDEKENKDRVEFGPNLAVLGPHEQFTVLSLSGGKPKKPNVIESLYLLLGPDFCSDVIVVETADHARLSLQLSYNWHFEVPDPCSPQDAAKLFSVPDFVGVMCKAIASRIRGTVASVQFDDFHKHSSRIIRAAVFGLDEQGKVLDQFIFPQNNLCITNIDVVSVEPVDQRTRDKLQKSIQLAIEITANSQEAAARRAAEQTDQDARARLERQKIEDELSAERARQTLLKIKVQSDALESSGQARAEALVRAEVTRIEAQAAVELSKLRHEAMAIKADARLECLEKARIVELDYISEKYDLTLKRKTEEAKIEFEHFSDMIGAIGADTLRSITAACPEGNIHMLHALGLQTTFITDATTPINLLNTAHGLIGTSMNMNRSELTHSTQDDEHDKLGRVSQVVQIERS